MEAFLDFIPSKKLKEKKKGFVRGKTSKQISVSPAMNATQSKGYRSSIVWICWPRQVTKQQSSLFITKIASKSLCMWCKHINTHTCTHSVCVCENTCLIHVNSMPAQKAKKKSALVKRMQN